MKILINEGRTSGLSHLRSLASPYKNPVSSWGRKSLGSTTGRGWEEHKSQVTSRVPRQRTHMELNSSPPVSHQDLRISPRKCCLTAEPWTQALCLQTGHSSTSTPSFVFAKLLRPIKFSLRLFVLTLHFSYIGQLIYLFFLTWQTFWGGQN